MRHVESNSGHHNSRFNFGPKLGLRLVAIAVQQRRPISWCSTCEFELIEKRCWKFMNHSIYKAHRRWGGAWALLCVSYELIWEDFCTLHVQPGDNTAHAPINIYGGHGATFNDLARRRRSRDHQKWSEASGNEIQQQITRWIRWQVNYGGDTHHVIIMLWWWTG